MKNYYLAIDIGASSGRHIIGSLNNGKIEYEEIYRFSNNFVKRENELCWDLDNLFFEIIKGLKKCKELNKIPISVGIDTWAVDFVLLDKNDNILGNSVSYRDSRTKGMDKQVYKIISENDLYKRTGIQKQIFNSIYQLMAIKNKNPKLLEEATSILMIPDYFNFLLTGNKVLEYTNATTTQLVSPITKDWDYELIEMLGYNKNLFKPLSLPRTIVGRLKSKIVSEVGFDCNVILPATHDTASAVVAIPTIRDDTIYISSGTWSLIGIEREFADCSIESKNANFTNEGGYNYKFRYLKNIMGLWMVQLLKKELKDKYSFEELCKMAEESNISTIINCNDNVFLNPNSIINEIKNYCIENNLEVPKTEADFAKVIYNSLSVCYKNAILEIENLTGKSYKSINIVGGGSNAQYLNKLTANATKKEVIAGPKEATALGNLVVQMIAENKFKDLSEARKCIYNSFSLKKY